MKYISLVTGAGLFLAVSGARAAGPEPLPDWPLATLDMRADDAEPIYQSDIEDDLDIGPDGTIPFWARADWDAEHCEDLEREYGSEWPKYKYIYSNGSVRQARFRVGFHCDRRTIFLEGGALHEELRLPGGLKDGKPHHFVLQVDDHGATIWRDGQAVGAMPVPFGEVKRVPLNVGSSANGASPWLGIVAGLRVWRNLVDVDVLESLKRRPHAELASVRAYGDLVGFMVPRGFEIKKAAVSPIGRWIGIDDVLDPQAALTSNIEEQNDFVPKPVTTTAWAKRCSRHADAAGVGRPADPAACDQNVLAVFISRIWAPPEVRLYAPSGDQRFTRIGGRGELRLTERNGQIQLTRDGRTLVRAPSEEADALFTDAWTKQVENFEALSMSVDARTLDLRFATTSPQGIPLFAMLPDQVGKRYRHIDNLATPYGAYANSDSVQCRGQRAAREMTNVTEVLDELERTYGSVKSQETRAAGQVGFSSPKFGASAGFKASWGGSLGNNQSLKSTAKELAEKEQSLVRQEARCTGYVFMLDPVRLELNAAFRDAVERLQGSFRSGGQRAVSAFIDRVGTHYANAVTFGGIASLETRITKEASDYANSLAQQFQTDKSKFLNFDAEGSVGFKGFSASASGGRSTSESTSKGRGTSNMERKMQSLMRTATRWETKGGVGGANFESWSSGGTQVPVYIQLRPIAELLAPPFFTDPEIVYDLRAAVEEGLGRALGPVDPSALRPFLTSSILPKKRWGESCPNFDIDCAPGFQCRDRGAAGAQNPDGDNWCYKKARSVENGGTCVHDSECQGQKCSAVSGTCGGPRQEVVKATCPSGFSLRGSRCIKTGRRAPRASSAPTCPSGYKREGTSCVKYKFASGPNEYFGDCPSGQRNLGTHCAAKNAGKAIGNFFTGKTKFNCNKVRCRAGYKRSGCKCKKTHMSIGSTKTALRCGGGKSLVGTTCLAPCPRGARGTGNQCIFSDETTAPGCPAQYRLEGGDKCRFSGQKATPPRPTPSSPSRAETPRESGGSGLEVGMDRPGSDLVRFSVASAVECQKECKLETECRAFTFANGTCYLKNRVPAARRKASCTSGVVRP